MYDVSPDGQRFLMIKAPGTDASAAPPALIVVQHWDEELKRLVPTTGPTMNLVIWSFRSFLVICVASDALTE